MTNPITRTVAVRAEPVGTLVAAVNGATVATVNLVGSEWVLNWSSGLIAAVNMALGAWIAVASVVVHAFRA